MVKMRLLVFTATGMAKSIKIGSFAIMTNQDQQIVKPYLEEEVIISDYKMMNSKNH